MTKCTSLRFLPRSVSVLPLIIHHFLCQRFKTHKRVNRIQNVWKRKADASVAMKLSSKKQSKRFHRMSESLNHFAIYIKSGSYNSHYEFLLCNGKLCNGYEDNKGEPAVNWNETFFSSSAPQKTCSAAYKKWLQLPYSCPICSFLLSVADWRTIMTGNARVECNLCNKLVAYNNGCNA